MDRRSWLWRRKSSDKSPGETESSGSISSHSERFSDEQAFAAIHSSNSAEMSSKSATGEEEVIDDVKTLSRKLSAALLSISTKEESVKQHAKVAEEAVSGWETAEKEVVTLKQQLEAAARKNSSLEERVSHLDGALKECVRQLRQANEQQNQRIQEAVSTKTQEWETRKSNLENHVTELQAELKSVKTRLDDSNIDDLQEKNKALERENQKLQTEILSRLEELEIRTIERDLSTQAAETASKQHLESIKKLTKIESECRRLKALARKSSAFTPSLNCAETFTDSGERSIVVENDAWKHVIEREPSLVRQVIPKTKMVPSIEINLMDDFLEMEKLASLPEDPKPGNKFLEAGTASGQASAHENRLRQEIETLRLKIAELNEKLEMTEVKNLQLETALTGSEKKVQVLQNQWKETEVKLSKIKRLESEKVSLETALVVAKKQLERSQVQLTEAEEKLTGLKKIKAEKQEIAVCLTESNKKVLALQNQLKNKEVELSQLKMLEDVNLELETALVESRKQLEALQNQLYEAEGKLAYLEKLKEENVELAISLTETKRQLETSQNQLTHAQDQLLDFKTLLDTSNYAERAAKNEANDANTKREVAESRLRDVELEVQSLVSKIVLLEENVEQERALSAKYSSKCEELQNEILELKHEVEPVQWQMYSFDGNWKMSQEKELAVAASKFAECQKTIASLGQQLKSLATFEDVLLESEDPLSITA